MNAQQFADAERALWEHVYAAVAAEIPGMVHGSASARDEEHARRADMAVERWRTRFAPQRLGLPLNPA